MSRLVITMRDPLAMRLATVAKLTGLLPEDIALCAVASVVGHIEREGGLALPLTLEAPHEPPVGSDMLAALDEAEDALKWYHEDHQTTPVAGKALMMVRAALAKATGKEVAS